MRGTRWGLRLLIVSFLALRGVVVDDSLVQLLRFALFFERLLISLEGFTTCVCRGRGFRILVLYFFMGYWVT